ncbi:hypothetical protein [Neorhizobium sp. NCHU2750]|uniref:hypothetical protein n=1 Tax=Neorhizobium sp. NCHU2750 TaxID=1825976 RepID=UPI0013C49172
MLDEGDYQAALMLSSGAYDQAKAAASFASRVKAGEQLIGKARRMQADALLIESRAKIALADQVDEAQAAGTVATAGRPKKVEGDHHFRLEDVGLSKEQVYEARKLRDAEKHEPGIVERAIQARVEAGVEPSRAALKKAAGHAIGTKTASKEERGDDLYETPIEAMRTLLALESFGLNVLEPSVGRGAILRPLEDAGYEVTISDLVDRGISTRHGECQGVGDFLTSIAIEGGWDIVTNPPYGVANAYAAHALREHKPRKMALLLNLNFQCGYEDADRRFVMDENPPSRIYAFAHRLPMMHRDDWQGNRASSQMNTGWFVWERNEDGSYGDGHPRLIRVVYDHYETAEALPPGAGGHVSPITFAVAKPDEEFTRTTPRKTSEERVEEEIHRAILWLKELEPFDAVKLRRGIGVRDSVAVALIEAMSANGLIHQVDDGMWMPTAEGMHLTANANAADMVQAWRAGKAVAA